MKKAIIIGASSGIGAALTMLLVNNNYKVAITGRRAALLNSISAQKPDMIIPFPFDISNLDIVSDKLSAIKEILGDLDLFVFCAGVGEINAELDINLDIPTIEVNVKAFNLTIVWAYRYFEKQEKGQIVAISSIAGLRGTALSPAYNASKAYQISYLEGLRQKAKKQKMGLDIIDVRPGFVDTAMAKAEKKFWMASPEKAAIQIYDAIKRRKNVIYVSKRWILIAWLFKLMPRFLYERM